MQTAISAEQPDASGWPAAPFQSPVRSLNWVSERTWDDENPTAYPIDGDAPLRAEAAKTRVRLHSILLNAHVVTRGAFA